MNHMYYTINYHLVSISVRVLLKIFVTRFSNSLVGYLFSEHPLKQHKKFKRWQNIFSFQFTSHEKGKRCFMSHICQVQDCLLLLHYSFIYIASPDTSVIPLLWYKKQNEVNVLFSYDNFNRFLHFCIRWAPI